jgi:hypothetical protein
MNSRLAGLIWIFTPANPADRNLPRSSSTVNLHGKEPGVYAGRESSSRFEQLALRAASEAVISESKGASLLNEPFVDFRERLVGLG